MSIKDATDQLLIKATTLQKIIQERLPESLLQSNLKDLITDLEKKEQIITVLGEFKRGKSTLINALIHEDLLPADVTPTTATINVIRYGDKPSLNIHLEDEAIVEKELTKEELQKITFSNGTDFTHINQVELNLPFIVLDKSVVLVDTPGVGDLNEHRVDVTYSYIPRSSVVIFVIDCSSPLRRSELDYLKNHIIPNVYGELIIVANFYDRIDEDEWEEVEDYIRKKLDKSLGETQYKLFALSAKEALYEEQDEQFQDFQSEINQLIQSGQAAQEKIKSYDARLTTIMSGIEEEVKNLQFLRNASEKEIIELQGNLQEFKKQALNHEESIEQYFADRKEEIKMISRKSVEAFNNKLKVSISQDIDDHPGGKFKNFLEVQIPKRIQHEVNAWISYNSKNIDMLLKKLEVGAYEGIEKLIKQNISVVQSNPSNSSLNTDIKRVKLSGKDDNASIMSGAVAGAGALALLTLGIATFLPLVALAGYPLINKFIGEKKLEEAKKTSKPIVEESIQKMTNTLIERIEKYIDVEAYRSQTDVIREFNRYLTNYKRELDYELQSKQGELSTTPLLTLGELKAVK